MHHPLPTDEFAQLLEAYVSSGKSEPAFVAIVERLGGLVYSSALRRTGNPQMAEEVMQNVFAILARKAHSLGGHPALTAWLFETTKLEAAQAMRTERRQQRKRRALAKETEATTVGSLADDEEEEWRDAVPLLDESLDRLGRNERRLILQRFFEERKIREIAALNGISEAACKMRLKRILTKLAQRLTARGATLSVAAVASALGAELTRAAPAHVLAAAAPKALTASGTLTTGALLTNTLLTMKLCKTIVIGAALVAAATAPVLWQPWESTENATINRSPASDPLATTKSLIETQGPTAASRIRELEDEILQLRQRNLELEQAQADHGVEKYGLDSAYIDTLKHRNLSENLIVSAEGQIKYELSNREVREINQAMRAFREMVQQYETDEMVVEESTEDQLVLKIPAFPEGDRFRDQVQETLEGIVGKEKGNRFFAEAQHTLSRSLMGFGSHDRVVTISKLQEPVVNIQDKQYNDTGSPFTSSWSTPLDEVPAQYRHIIQLTDE